MRKTILLADNHLELLDTQAEYLELAGYHVVKVSSPGEARQKILNENIHLAVLDVRLIDDKDGDRSGLELAKSIELRFIPTIMITGFPTADDVRNVLRPGESNVVDYVFKDDGPQSMIEAVNKAFESHIHINQNLIFDWGESGLSIPGLIGMLKKNETINYSFRHEEMDDLLRMAFYSYSRVHFVKTFWLKNKRVAVLVQASDHHAERVFALTLGFIPEITHEAHQKSLFPDNPADGYTKHETFIRRAHYATNLWRLGGADFGKLDTLTNTAESLRNKFGVVIDNLLHVTLSAWHHQRAPQEISGDIYTFYQPQMPIFGMDNPYTVWLQRITELAKEAHRLNLTKELSIADDQLIIGLPGRKSVTFPDPVKGVLNHDFSGNAAVLYTQNSPGSFDPNTILVGPENVTWLTDFVHAGAYPVWHDFAQLEAKLRFCFVESIHLTEIYDLEQQLRPNWPRALRNNPTCGPEWSKYIAAILKVRAYAYDQVHHEPDQYALCLLLAILSEFFGSETPVMRNSKDVARLIHRLIVAGMIAEDLQGKNCEHPTLQTQYPQLIIDETENMVLLENKTVPLTKTEFRLILFLYKANGKPCSREAICREVFDTAEPEPEQLHGMIDTPLSRLRQKIEPDPKNPCYILTVHGLGIQLITAPKR